MVSSQAKVYFGTAREAAIVRAYTTVHHVLIGGLIIGFVAEMAGWIPGHSPTRLLLAMLGMFAVDQLVRMIWLRRIHRGGHKAIVAACYRVCPGCGYSLDGLALAGDCPECCRPYSPEALKNYWDNVYSFHIQGFRKWRRTHSADIGSAFSWPPPTRPKDIGPSTDTPSKPSTPTPHTPPASPTPPPDASTN